MYISIFSYHVHSYVYTVIINMTFSVYIHTSIGLGKGGRLEGDTKTADIPIGKHRGLIVGCRIYMYIMKGQGYFDAIS